jgi:hypothetical protein
MSTERYLGRKVQFSATGCNGNQPAVPVCTAPVPYNEYDWTDDGCSFPWYVKPLVPRVFREMWEPACEIHDFGYRNFGKGLGLGRDEDHRRWIDDRLKVEMYKLCTRRYHRKYRDFRRRRQCHEAAYEVWAGLRHRGRDAYYA